MKEELIQEIWRGILKRRKFNSWELTFSLDKRKEELIQEILRRITEDTKFQFLTADFSAFLQHISGERRERGPADRVEGKKTSKY